jgi:hypothetical protein
MLATNISKATTRTAMGTIEGLIGIQGNYFYVEHASRRPYCLLS